MYWYPIPPGKVRGPAPHPPFFVVREHPEARPYQPASFLDRRTVSISRPSCTPIRVRAVTCPPRTRAATSCDPFGLEYGSTDFLLEPARPFHSPSSGAG